MKYVEKDEKSKKVYGVYYDADKLKDLLDRVIKKTSYREHGTFTAPFRARYMENIFVDKVNLPNGDPMYEDIESIYSFESGGPYGYHDDSVGVVGVEVHPPRLAKIINGIIQGDEESIPELINYVNYRDLIPINERIAKANQEASSIDNFDTDNKIGALERLKELCEDKDKGRYYDTKLLEAFYFEALSLIELRLEEETIYHPTVYKQIKYGK